MASPIYKRVLLKLSGEQFAAGKESGITVEFIHELAKEIKQVIDATGVQMAIVIGGGNYIRGATLAAHGIERATGDYMGMLATLINGMALLDVLEHNGQPARLMTRLRVDNVAEPYIRRRGLRHMEKGRVVIVGGGTGNPYVTTDTAAITTALELGAEIVLKATKVDGVYDRDPARHSEAIRKDSVRFSDALIDEQINVMDNAAISLAMDNSLPIIIFDLLKKGNLEKILTGESVGTLIN